MNTKKNTAVLLATYNGSKYIEEFLLSLENQIYKNFDLICIDDLSTDETLNIIKGFEDKLNIIYIENKIKLGAAGAFFTLLEKSEDFYDYYLFADQDDVWDKEKIYRSVIALEKMATNKPNLYAHRLELVDESLSHLSYAKIPKYISFENALVQNIFPGCTMAFNKKAKKLVAGKTPNSKYIMHDWWLYVLVSAIGNVTYDRQSLIKYRQHDSNTVGMASNFFSEYKIRLDRFFKDNKQGVFGIAHQANYFFDIYKEDISKNDLKTVKRLLENNKFFLNRLYMFFFTKLKRQTFMDNLILRIILLIGRY